MPRGGYRPGAGRPKGAKSRVTVEIPGQSPLEHMLSVMSDPEADVARLDRMAVAAAPYVHARAMLAAEDEPPKGVKAERERKAKQIAVGSLATPEPPRSLIPFAGRKRSE